MNIIKQIAHFLWLPTLLCAAAAVEWWALETWPNVTWKIILGAFGVIVFIYVGAYGHKKTYSL